MSKLSDIEARDAMLPDGIERSRAYMPSEIDRRYLLGLVKEAIRVSRNVRDSQESDLGAYSRWVGEQMTELLAQLEE